MFNYVPDHRPGDGARSDAAGRHLYEEDVTRDYLFQLMDDHPHRRQRDGVCGHRAGSRPLLRRIAEAAGDLNSNGASRASGTAAEDAGGRGAAHLCHPAGPVRPGPAATSPRVMHRMCYDRLSRAGQQRQRRSRPVHRSARCGHGHLRPEQIRPHSAGRPSRHGQDLAGPEHLP